MFKKKILTALVTAFVFLTTLGLPVSVNAITTCTPTGFFRDSINMTAAFINPGDVSGEVDATGCNIGVYYDSGVAVVSGAEIHGANYFGVLINGDVNEVAVDVVNSQIHDIGETPLNGSQHGVGIYYRAFGAGTATGIVRGNELDNYQKGGIVVNGAGATVSVRDNTVTGEGAVAYIAQNGIQFGFGSHGSAINNTATGHSYSGPNFASSGGILIVGGACYGIPDFTIGIQVVGNTLIGNDVGVFISNLDEDCEAPDVQTNIKVVNNVITYDAVNNTTGGGGVAYQAGVSDVGNNDKIINNVISGVGYEDCSLGYCVAIDADVSFTNNPKVHANNTP